MAAVKPYGRKSLDFAGLAAVTPYGRESLMQAWLRAASKQHPTATDLEGLVSRLRLTSLFLAQLTSLASHEKPTPHLAVHLPDAVVDQLHRVGVREQLVTWKEGVKKGIRRS